MLLPTPNARNVNKKFVELNYVGYLKLQNCILKLLVSVAL